MYNPIRSVMIASSFGLAASLGAAAAIADGYSNSFEAGVGAEWSSATRSTAANFSTFLGRFGNNRINLTLDTTAGEQYRLAYDLYIIDSWDGNSANWGNDFFNIAVGGATVFSESFTNGTGARTWTGAASEGGPGVNLGFASNWADSIYRDMGVDFIATGPTTTISFFGQGLQGLNDESWGIDNVHVSRVSVPAPGGAALASFAIFGAMGRNARRRKPNS